ncbi:hypothetical protein C8Q72DRAFT_859408 [Fomitopsis betulina]|nr:hypothetical protein C8Q72DRAFT_859408 [Fomitopsis betulina]
MQHLPGSPYPRSTRPSSSSCGFAYPLLLLAARPAASRRPVTRSCTSTSSRRTRLRRSLRSWRARFAATTTWDTELAPRILLWHMSYLQPAMDTLPCCRIARIGFNVSMARTWFWDSCYVIRSHLPQWATGAG